MVSGAAGAAQTQKNNHCWPAQKPCIKNPSAPWPGKRVTTANDYDGYDHDFGDDDGNDVESWLIQRPGGQNEWDRGSRIVGGA